jgi:hypothetical protein
MKVKPFKRFPVSMLLVHRAKAAVLMREKGEPASLTLGCALGPSGSKFWFVMQLERGGAGQDAQLWYIPGHLIRAVANECFIN